MKKLQAEFREKEFLIRHFGDEVYAVGGYVRDLIRGIPSEDVDVLITHHSVEDIIKIIQPYGKVDLVGKSFGIIKFTINGKTYDLALPRKEVPRGTGVKKHKDFIISAEPNLPIEKDLERRDFRCNSIALRLTDNKVIDPFHGASDIKSKKIRLSNPASFPDDPLRILRVARFASVLEFSVDPQIYETSAEIDLSGLSVERVNEEVFKILLFSPLPSVGLEELFKLGAIRQLFQELYSLTLSIQDPLFHPERDKYGNHTVWHHTKLTVDQAKRLSELAQLSQEKKLALLLASLYHDVGKPSTAQWEFKKGRMVVTNNGHDVLSEKITKKILSRFRIFSWNGYKLRKTILSLIKCHHRASELWQNREVVTKKAFNRLAADISGEIELLVYLDASDRAGRKEKPIIELDEEARWLLRKFKELDVTKETIKPLIMGRELIKMEVAPGPLIGKILKKLYELQLDNEFETKKEGLQIAKTIIEKELP